MRIMRRPLTKHAESVAVGLATFALYVATRYPGLGGRVNYGDSAKFAFLGAIGGIGHPPGNPLYTLLTVLAVRVPGLAPATAVTLLSALFGAATIALVYGTARRTFSAVSALAAAGAVALGPQFARALGHAQFGSLHAQYVFHCALGRWRNRGASRGSVQ